MKGEFETVLEYVQSELDFAVAYYNDSYLQRRIRARLRRTDTDTYGGYRRLLERDDRERVELLDALSINVTSFFRNPKMWRRLRQVLRSLASDSTRLRIWSAPCSDGREPYSIAMLVLDDPEIDADTVRIVGSDISEDALEAARAGRYHTAHTTDIDAELDILDDYTPYVDRDGDTFTVTDRVRDLVSFRRHDLIQGEPMGRFDLVMCRNLLIYIAPEYTRPIFETLDGTLGRDGYLVVGMTESLHSSFNDRYDSVGQGTGIHRKTTEGG